MLEAFHVEGDHLRSFRTGRDITPLTGRLGLHVTDGELAVWRQRAVSGPFRVAGDHSTNSPGDWTRIVGQAADHVTNLAVGYYAPTSTPPLGTSFASYQKYGRWVRSAAFLNLVRHPAEDTSAYRNAVKTRLLTQASLVDFSNRGIWPLRFYIEQNPSFEIAEWLLNHLHAYDYLRAYELEVGNTLFTKAERATLLLWFYNGADYWHNDPYRSWNSLWGIARWDTPPTYATLDFNHGTGPTVYLHDGAQTYSQPSFSRHYNNRRAQLVRFPAAAGVLLAREGFSPPSGADPGRSVQFLRDQGRLFVEEYVKFSHSPAPSWWGDGNRWTEPNPHLGWAYAGAVIGALVQIADTEARVGNPAIYGFSTTYGQAGSQTATPKSLRTVIEDYQSYVREERALFGSNVLTNDTFYYRITTRAGVNRPRVRDACVAQATRWYDDPLMAATALRQVAGSPSWPADPEDAWAWEGSNFELPGVLFMFADTGTDPYPGAAP
jgi:hypothetical protein